MYKKLIKIAQISILFGNSISSGPVILYRLVLPLLLLFKYPSVKLSKFSIYLLFICIYSSVLNTYGATQDYGQLYGIIFSVIGYEIGRTLPPVFWKELVTYLIYTIPVFYLLSILGINLIEPENRGSNSLYGFSYFFTNTNEFGAYIGLFLMISICQMRSYITLIISIYLIFFGFINYAVGTFILGVIGLTYLLKIFILFPLVFSFYYFYNSIIILRIYDKIDGIYDLSDPRIFNIHQSFMGFLENPFGNGIGSFVVKYNRGAHNYFAENIHDIGLASIPLLLYIFIRLNSQNNSFYTSLIVLIALSINSNGIKSLLPIILFMFLGTITKKIVTF